MIPRYRRVAVPGFERDRFTTRRFSDLDIGDIFMTPSQGRAVFVVLGPAVRQTDVDGIAVAVTSRNVAQETAHGLASPEIMRMWEGSSVLLRLDQQYRVGEET